MFIKYWNDKLIDAIKTRAIFESNNLLDNFKEEIKNRSWDYYHHFAEEVANVVIENEDINMIIYLYENGFPFDYEMHSVLYSSLGRSGNIKLLLKFDQHKLNGSYDDAFISGCHNNHMKFIKELVQLKPYLIAPIKRTSLMRLVYFIRIPEDIIVNISKNGNKRLEIIEKLLEWFPNILEEWYRPGDKIELTVLDFTLYYALMHKQFLLIDKLMEWTSKSRIIEKIIYLDLITIDMKVIFFRPICARIKIKYWLIAYLYNPNTKWGLKYTNRLLMEDNEIVR